MNSTQLKHDALYRLGFGSSNSLDIVKNKKIL